MLQQLYIRGNQIVFCIVPDMLRNAPMFARIKQWRKYKGHPPVLASEGAKGQRAAIIRKGGNSRQSIFFFKYVELYPQGTSFAMYVFM